MKGRFIEGGHNELALQLDPESDDERLLLRVFSQQAEGHANNIKLSGWGLGGERPGFRYLRLYFSETDKAV